MIKVTFSLVPIGGWFKESVGGSWHLKTDGSTGMYYQSGVGYKPVFKQDEFVFVG
jgi:hypothetical protein